MLKKKTWLLKSDYDSHRTEETVHCGPIMTVLKQPECAACHGDGKGSSSQSIARLCRTAHDLMMMVLALDGLVYKPNDSQAKR